MLMKSWLLFIAPLIVLGVLFVSTYRWSARKADSSKVWGARGIMIRMTLSPLIGGLVSFLIYKYDSHGKTNKLNIIVLTPLMLGILLYAQAYVRTKRKRYGNSNF